MKILSLFDGMSVAQQALKDVGKKVDTYYSSEIDPYAIAVTQPNHQDTIQLGSVTDIRVGMSWNGVPHYKWDINLMVGGSPCQDLSIAKKGREGLAGSRSGLFWEYVRIRDENLPEYFILENVASMPKEAKDTISEALGVQPVMINASLVSAQNRKRLFWVGKYNGQKYEQVEIPQPEDRGILLKDILESGDTDRLKSYCVDANYYKGTNLEHYLAKGVRQVVMLTEQRTEEAKAIRRENMKEGKDYSPRRDKELVPRKDEKANTITTGQTKESFILIPEATKQGYAIAQDGDSVDLSFPTSKTRRGRVGNKVKNLMTSQNIGVFTQGVIRKLTPTECLRLQSMPDDYFDKAEYKGKPISNTQRYKMCGNAFNKEVIVHIINNLK